jgi:hypothetical protein
MPHFFFDVEHGLTLYEDHEGVVCPNLDVARQMAQDLINDLHEDAERIPALANKGRIAARRSFGSDYEAGRLCRKRMGGFLPASPREKAECAES